jgi:hypothetical protein
MSSSLKQKVKKSRRASSPAASLFSGNHTTFTSMEFQLKMDRPVPLAAENPKIDIMKTRYFFLALMSTVNDCMSFPPLCLRFSIIIYLLVIPYKCLLHGSSPVFTHSFSLFPRNMNIILLEFNLFYCPQKTFCLYGKKLIGVIPISVKPLCLHTHIQKTCGRIIVTICIPKSTAS